MKKDLPAAWSSARPSGNRVAGRSLLDIDCRAMDATPRASSAGVHNRMAAVRHSGTAPEQAVRRALHRLGYRLARKAYSLPGQPDIVLPKHRVTLFVHGCFWHGHSDCAKGARRSRTNEDYWNAKIDSNVARDARVMKELAELGWRACVIWECETKDARTLDNALKRALSAALRRAGHLSQ